MVTGSFNPITKGHEDIVLRAAEKFDEVIVAVFNNAEKKYDFTRMCKNVFFLQSFRTQAPHIYTRAAEKPTPRGIARPFTSRKTCSNFRKNKKEIRI